MSILTEIVETKTMFLKRLPVLTAVSLCENPFMRCFEQFAVITECKAKSPSEGEIVADYDPVCIAKTYESAGAHAVSVLTDEPYFGGSFEDLSAVSSAVRLPTLCKDFIVDENQLLHARKNGASACLLIMAILSDTQAKRLKAKVESLNMVAVMEAYNAEELRRAVHCSPEVLLINNRNLHDFSMGFERLSALCEKIPAHIKVISASGIKQPSDLAKLPKRVDGVLIGTALMRSPDKTVFIKGLLDER